MATDNSSAKATGALDPSGIILWSPTRPDIYFARREITQLVLLSLAFAFVFLYPILCNSSVTDGPGIGAWILRPQLGHFTGIPSDGTDRDMFTQLRVGRKIGVLPAIHYALVISNHSRLREFEYAYVLRELTVRRTRRDHVHQHVT